MEILKFHSLILSRNIWLAGRGIYVLYKVWEAKNSHPPIAFSDVKPAQAEARSWELSLGLCDSDPSSWTMTSPPGSMLEICNHEPRLGIRTKHSDVKLPQNLNS